MINPLHPKQLWTLVSVSLAMIACTGVGMPLTSAQQRSSIDICYSGGSVAQVVGWYGTEKGIFEKYDLDVNLIQISSGSRAATALIAGDMEFCQMSGSSVVSATVAGGELAIIAGFLNTYPYSLMVSESITSAEDLRGKAVAISSPGSASDTAMRVALQALGLEPETEVTLLSVGGQGERLAAMETDQVFGTLLTVPSTTEAEELGYKELLDMAKLDQAYQHTGMVTTRAVIEENPEWVDRVLRASIESIEGIKRDPEGTQQVMADYLLLDTETDAKSLTTAYDKLVEVYLPEIPYPSSAGIQTLLDELEVSNPDASNFRPEDIIELSFLEKLEQEGFTDTLSE